MKHLTEKFNENISIQLGYNSYINEAWGVANTFERDLKKLFADYEKAKEANDKKRSKSKWGPHMYFVDEAEKLAKYPMTILIQKAGLNQEDFKQVYNVNGKDKETIHKAKYGNFILKGLEEGKFTKEDLVSWWKEYAENIAKKQYHDPKWLVKQIDPSRLWNPYMPKDDSVIVAMLNEPANMVRYLNTWKLSKEERDDLNQFLVDPANQYMLKKALKSIKNSWMKLKPSFSTAALEHVKSIIDNVKVGDKSLKDLLEKEYNSSHNRSYYSGSNDRDCYGSAVVGIVLKVLNKIYGFDIYHSLSKDEDSQWGGVQSKVRFKDKVEDASLEGFVDDASNELKFEIKDLGASDKKDNPTVSSSSFTTNYYHNFEVKLLKWEGKDDYKELFSGTIENVIIGSSFFSGGW